MEAVVTCATRVHEGKQVASEWQASGKRVASKWQTNGKLVASEWRASGKQVAGKSQASGKRVASKCKIMSTVGQFLSLSKRLRTECMSASKWRELQLLGQLLNPEPVILLSPKR